MLPSFFPDHNFDAWLPGDDRFFAITLAPFVSPHYASARLLSFNRQSTTPSSTYNNPTDQYQRASSISLARHARHITHHVRTRRLATERHTVIAVHLRLPNAPASKDVFDHKQSRSEPSLHTRLDFSKQSQLFGRNGERWGYSAGNANQAECS